MRILLACAVLILAAAAGTAGARAQTPARIRGTIVALVGDRLGVKESAASVYVELAADATVTAAAEASLADARPGTFIGSAAIRQPDGSLRALEVHIFPESMRGTGEGNRPWDRGPDSSMTNGTVGAPDGQITSSSGRTLSVTYPSGRQVITVPEDVAVIAYAPGTRASLVPGATVFINAIRADDGTLHANRITVAAPGVRMAM